MAPSCQEAGVLGVLPGVVGVLQATEAIKIVLGIGKTLAGRLLMYDALATKFREMKLRRDPKCPTCGDGVDRSKIELIDYEQFCYVCRRSPDSFCLAGRTARSRTRCVQARLPGCTSLVSALSPAGMQARILAAGLMAGRGRLSSSGSRPKCGRC